VTTESAEDVSPTSATLRGTVNANGRTTYYRIQYGTSTSYGQATPPQSVPADGALHLVTQGVSGLSPMTTYHFRFLALNAVGPGYGVDKTFTTGDAFKGAIVKSKTAKEKNGRVKIKVLCPTGTPGSCVGKLTLKSASKVSVNGHRKTLTIGRSPFNIAPSTSSRTVSVTVLATALDYLHRHGKLTATAIATSHDSFGTTKSNRRTVKLTAKKQP
jgi:Fibronectin type III domain